MNLFLLLIMLGAAGGAFFLYLWYSKEKKVIPSDEVAMDSVKAPALEVITRNARRAIQERLFKSGITKNLSDWRVWFGWNPLIYIRNQAEVQAQVIKNPKAFDFQESGHNEDWFNEIVDEPVPRAARVRPGTLPDSFHLDVDFGFHYSALKSLTTFTFFIDLYGSSYDFESRNKRSVNKTKLFMRLCTKYRPSDEEAMELESIPVDPEVGQIQAPKTSILAYATSLLPACEKVIFHANQYIESEMLELKPRLETSEDCFQHIKNVRHTLTFVGHVFSPAGREEVRKTCAAGYNLAKTDVERIRFLELLYDYYTDEYHKARDAHFNLSINDIKYTDEQKALVWALEADPSLSDEARFAEYSKLGMHVFNLAKDRVFRKIIDLRRYEYTMEIALKNMEMCINALPEGYRWLTPSANEIIARYETIFEHLRANEVGLAALAFGRFENHRHKDFIRHAFPYLEAMRLVCSGIFRLYASRGTRIVEWFFYKGVPDDLELEKEKLYVYLHQSDVWCAGLNTLGQPERFIIENEELGEQASFVHNYLKGPYPKLDRNEYLSSQMCHLAFIVSIHEAISKRGYSYDVKEDSEFAWRRFTEAYKQMLTYGPAQAEQFEQHVLAPLRRMFHEKRHEARLLTFHDEAINRSRVRRRMMNWNILYPNKVKPVSFGYTEEQWAETSASTSSFMLAYGLFRRFGEGGCIRNVWSHEETLALMYGAIFKAQGIAGALTAGIIPGLHRDYWKVEGLHVYWFNGKVEIDKRTRSGTGGARPINQMLGEDLRFVKQYLKSSPMKSATSSEEDYVKFCLAIHKALVKYAMASYPSVAMSGQHAWRPFISEAYKQVLNAYASLQPPLRLTATENKIPNPFERKDSQSLEPIPKAALAMWSQSARFDTKAASLREEWARKSQESAAHAATSKVMTFL